MALNTSYTEITLHGLREASEICLKCGVCCVIKGFSCPAQYDHQFTPTETYVYDALGSPEPAKNLNIWTCVSCHKCEEMCPYEVSPIHFIEQMKAQALKEGYAPDSITSEMQQVIETGYAFPITPNTHRQRETLNLPPVKTTDALRIIAEKTGLMEILDSLKEEVE